jgi:diaminohydroxyphosphoribosylaminopyrimidine deaminase/5-amino-6-(5-phosphoribosylamino)uracil reductase
MDYMEQAIAFAKLAIGQVSPNPAVGAVIVNNGNTVGQGFTQPPGSWHAEIMALKQAREKAKGGIMYVTLEPCCHYGRTPPCTKAVIASGIREVHLATIDPNPIVAGKGRAELERHGIKTFVGEYEEQANEIMEAYAKHITTGLPFVVAKFAMSLDGKIATKTGDSHWITAEEARRYAHNLRCNTDAIMVGANTIIIDDPQLTVRCCGGRGGVAKKQPLRVVIDGKGRTPATARLFKEPGETLVATGKSLAVETKQALTATGAEIVELSAGKNKVELTELLRILGRRGITSILVEGGGILLGSLFDAGLVDKVIAFIAPVIIGGSKAKLAIAGNGIDKMINACRLERIRTENIGVDIMVTGYVSGGKSCLPAL